MPAITDLAAPLDRLTPAGVHHFFGYYDVPAALPDGRHLCHQVAFRDRLPQPDDLATLGTIELAQPAFEPFATTRAWNFQQGSLLQWLPSRPGACLYNVFESGRFGACLHDLAGGGSRVLPRAVANVSPDGRHGLCVNMARLFAFRPGYGYEELPDPFADQLAPAEDGIELLDLASGEHRQILSLERLATFLREGGALTEPRKLVVNHITFSPSGERFMFLLRTFVTQPGQPWLTFLLTARPDGSELRQHEVWNMASHYHWRNDHELLLWANLDGDKSGALYVLDVRDDRRTLVDPAFFRADGHCSWSPDGRWILYDSYPDTKSADFPRWLAVYSTEQRRGYTLGRFRSEAQSRPGDATFVDRRCDLHPRWLPDGRTITFDSIHEGYRGVYRLDLRGILG